MDKNGAFEKVTRERVDNLAKEVTAGFKSISSRLRSIEENQQILFNHQSKRLPLWTTAIITILSSLVVGLIVTLLK